MSPRCPKVDNISLHFVKVELEYLKKVIIEQKWANGQVKIKDAIDKGGKRKFSTCATRSVRAVDLNNGIKVE